jgi:branched-chain amino acid aminotransferase
MNHPIVYLNGSFVPESEARVPLLTHALHYGTGVFEGIRGYREAASGELYLFRPLDHFQRMAGNVKLLHMSLPSSPSDLVDATTELIRRNQFTEDVYVRPILYKSAARVGVTLPDEQSFAILAVPFGKYVDGRKGLNCMITSWRRLQDNSIPCRGKICGAYVNSALASHEARIRGFDEAIFLNESGHVAEGSAENLFLVRKGHLITPDVSQGILEGITRDTLISIARETMGLEVESRAVDRTELYVADEVFLCGTAAEVAPVINIDERRVADGLPGRITLRLQRIYEQMVHGLLPRHRPWLEPCYRVRERYSTVA